MGQPITRPADSRSSRYVALPQILMQMKQKSLSQRKPSFPHLLLVPPGVWTTEPAGLGALKLSRRTLTTLLARLFVLSRLFPFPPLLSERGVRCLWTLEVDEGPESRLLARFFLLVVVLPEAM